MYTRYRESILPGFRSPSPATSKAGLDGLSCPPAGNQGQSTAARGGHARGSSKEGEAGAGRGCPDPACNCCLPGPGHSRPSASPSQEVLSGSVPTQCGSGRGWAGGPLTSGPDLAWYPPPLMGLGSFDTQPAHLKTPHPSDSLM